jgi:hypothetical protein
LFTETVALTTVPCFPDRLIQIDESTLDRRAVLAFVQGQCHAMALALCHRTRWELLAIEKPNGGWDHVCVSRPDGLLHDVTGAHPRDAVLRGRHALEVDETWVRGLERTWNWAPPATDVAALFVDAVLQREPGPPACSEVMKTFFRSGDVEVLVEWAGQSHFDVYVRRCAEWVEYGPFRPMRPNDAGMYLIDFTHDYFARTATAWFQQHFDVKRAQRALGVSR